MFLFRQPLSANSFSQLFLMWLTLVARGCPVNFFWTVRQCLDIVQKMSGHPKLLDIIRKNVHTYDRQYSFNLKHSIPTVFFFYIRLLTMECWSVHPGLDIKMEVCWTLDI